MPSELRPTHVPSRETSSFVQDLKARHRLGASERLAESMKPSTAMRVAIVAACTIGGAVWLYRTGPLPVIRITTVLPEMVPWWYSLSAFPVLGMLAADLVSLLRASGFDRRPVELACQIGILVLASNLRLGFGVPLSGHALLFSYFIARRAALDSPDGKGPIARAEIVIALILLALTAFAKLVWWTDPITLTAGVIIGVTLASGSWLFARWVGPAWVGRV